MEGIPGCFGFGVPQPYDLTHYSPVLGGYWDFPESPEPQVWSLPLHPSPVWAGVSEGPQKQCCSPPTPRLCVCLDLSLPLCLCVSLSMSLSLLTQPSESANFKPGFSLK